MEVNTELYKKLQLDREVILAQKSNYIDYVFNQDDLDFIKKKLDNIEILLGIENVKNIEFRIVNKDDDTYIQYDLNSEFVNTLSKDKQKLCATWCLGKQIQYAINKTGECFMNCEL